MGSLALPCLCPAGLKHQEREGPSSRWAGDLSAGTLPGDLVVEQHPGKCGLMPGPGGERPPTIALPEGVAGVGGAAPQFRPRDTVSLRLGTATLCARNLCWRPSSRGRARALVPRAPSPRAPRGREEVSVLRCLPHSGSKAGPGRSRRRTREAPLPGGGRPGAGPAGGRRGDPGHLLQPPAAAQGSARRAPASSPGGGGGGSGGGGGCGPSPVPPAPQIPRRAAPPWSHAEPPAAASASALRFVEAAPSDRRPPLAPDPCAYL